MVVAGLALPATAASKPPKPKSVKATATSSSVTLTWKSGKGSTKGFNVYRATSGRVQLSKPLNGKKLITKTTFKSTRLSSNKSYWFVVQSVNSSGRKAQASALRVTTLLRNPAVPTLTATAADRQVKLSWKPGSGGGSATGWQIYRSTTSSSVVKSSNLITAKKLSGSTRSYTDSNRTNGTTYYYVLVASNNGGSARSKVAQATPQPPAPGAPVLVATPGDTTVGLSWTPSGSAATSYTVHRSATAPFAASDANKVKTVAGGTTSTTDTGLTNNTAYYYVVVARNGGGSHASNTVSAAPQTSIPGVPVLSVSPNDNRADLTWTGEATSWKVFRATAPSVPTGGTPLATIADGSVHAYSDTTAVNGTAYYYVVIAVIGTGATSSNEVTVTPMLPAPSAAVLSATPGDGKVDLSWTPGTGGGAVASWRVYRSTTGTFVGSAFATINDPSVTTYTDSTANNGTTYHYLVVSVNAAGTAQSNAPTATPQVAAPSAPSLTATAGDGEVELNWTAGAGGGAVAQWRIFRGTGDGAVDTSGTPLATRTVSTTYTDTSAVNGTAYKYVVVARNATADTPSAAVSATPQVPAPSAPSLSASGADGEVDLSWTPGAGGGAVASWRIFRGTGDGAVDTSGTPLATRTPGQTTYNDTAVTNGTTYKYVVVARNATADAPSAEASATPNLQAPGTPNLTATGSNGSVSLNWSASVGGGAVASWDIFRSTSTPVSTSGSPLASRSAGTTSYTDEAVTNGTTYHYVVVAVNATGSTASASKSATPTSGGGSASLSLVNPEAVPGSSNWVMSRMGYSPTPTSMLRVENPDFEDALTWYRVKDTATVRVSNTGGTAAQITSLAFSDTLRFTTTVSAPLTVPAGGSVDIPIRFVATGPGDGTYGPKVLAETLTITATGLPTMVAQLRGEWQPGVSRNGPNGTSNFEPGLDMIVNDLFGWSTEIDALYDMRRDRANGDEVLSAFWKAANPAQPIEVTRIAAYSGFALTPFQWYNRTNATGCAGAVAGPGCTNVFAENGFYEATNPTATEAQASLGQTVLPLEVGGTQWRSFSPGTTEFGLQLGVGYSPEFSDYSRNSTEGDASFNCTPLAQCGKHLRFYPVKTAGGTVVPNTYIVTFDILAANIDYNDNVFIMTNATPAS